MGYFPNGTSGESYEAAFCSRCRHENSEDGCPVMLAHVLYAYDECNSDSNAKRILDMLIPVHSKGNATCAMFAAKPAPRKKRTQLKMFGGGAK